MCGPVNVLFQSNGKSLKLGQIKLGELQVLIRLTYILDLNSYTETEDLLCFLLSVPALLNSLLSRSERSSAIYFVITVNRKKQPVSTWNSASEKNELSLESLSIYLGPGFRGETYCLRERLAQSRSLLLVCSAQVVSRPRKKVSRYEVAPFG